MRTRVRAVAALHSGLVESTARIERKGDLASSRCVDRIRSLAQIHEPTLSVCVWRRPLPPSLSAGITLADGGDASADLPPDASGARALVAGVDASAQRAVLRDIGKLVRFFAATTGAGRVKASFARVTNDKCRKFHADYKTLRLVCTYVGPGTEWVDDRHLDRSAFGCEETTFLMANQRIVPCASNIQSARAGDVVLLKGERFPGFGGRGAVHRSPPIEHLAQSRIVLTLDVG